MIPGSEESSLSSLGVQAAYEREERVAMGSLPMSSTYYDGFMDKTGPITPITPSLHPIAAPLTRLSSLAPAPSGPRDAPP